MALQEVTSSFLRRVGSARAPLLRVWGLQCRRYAAAEPATDIPELEQTKFLNDETVQERPFNPLERAQKRNRELPPSRYQYRSPRYYRGPLHPHQPPRPSDPASREFIPGPFSLPRLEQTYHDTIASDIMTLTYMHYPPGHEPHQKGERLRSWVGDNPYFKNRPLRGPRGGEVLRMLRKPITWHNIPQLTRVTVHTMQNQAKDNSAFLHVAGMVLQAITNVRVTAHATRKAVAGFRVRKGQNLSVTCNLTGEDMYHFLSKLVDVVLPKIKEWRGMKGSSGDESGNFAFGLNPDDVALFPEIEVNYDMYPPKMIPGCHVIIHTSAKNDSDARLLLTSIGIPFYGKLVD